METSANDDPLRINHINIDTSPKMLCDKKKAASWCHIAPQRWTNLYFKTSCNRMTVV